MYARITETGALEIYRKKYIRLGEAIIANPSAPQMLAAGYKPLVNTEPPSLKGGETLVIDYKDTGERIESVYTVIGGLK